MFASCRKYAVITDFWVHKRRRSLDEVQLRLQLNSDKTEVLWCATNRRLHQLPVSAMLIDGAPIIPAMYVRDLGIYLDRDLSMRTHVLRTVSKCFAALRQLRQIRHSVPAATFQTLVVALIHSSS